MEDSYSGSDNTVVGFGALFLNETGSRNVAIGKSAGRNATGDDNIYVSHLGEASESGTIRLGTDGTHTATFVAGVFGQGVDAGTAAAVRVDSTGKVGTVPSSRRFKKNIEEMGEASRRLLALRPVAFDYVPELAGDAPRQYGLIAEEVDEVYPSLVVYDGAGQPYSVRYEMLTSLLLNELQRQQRQIEVLEADRRELRELRARLESLEVASQLR